VNLPLPAPELYDWSMTRTRATTSRQERPEVVAEIRSRIRRLIATFPEESVRLRADQGSQGLTHGRRQLPTRVRGLQYPVEEYVSMASLQVTRRPLAEPGIGRNRGSGSLLENLWRESERAGSYVVSGAVASWAPRRTSLLGNSAAAVYRHLERAQPRCVILAGLCPPAAATGHLDSRDRELHHATGGS